MSRRAPPIVTVCSGDVRRTFPPGRDIIVGRDVRADLRVFHPAISRAHVILRCHDGQWIAIDNKSRSGMFVDALRVQSTPVRDGKPIHLGDPDGPQLTFEFAPAPDERPTMLTKRPFLRGRASSEAVTDSRVRWRGDSAAPRRITIGRELDGDIVVPDVLASRHHATLVATPSGTQIHDERSMNGRTSTASGSRTSAFGRTTSSRSATSTWSSPPALSSTAPSPP